MVAFVEILGQRLKGRLVEAFPPRFL